MYIEYSTLYIAWIDMLKISVAFTYVFEYQTHSVPVIISNITVFDKISRM